METTLFFSRFYRTTLILSNFIKENKITSRVRSALSSPHCWFRFYARSPEPLRLSILLSILSYSIMQPRCYGAATTARACCRLRGLCGGALGSAEWHMRGRAGRETADCSTRTRRREEPVGCCPVVLATSPCVCRSDGVEAGASLSSRPLRVPAWPSTVVEGGELVTMPA